MHSDFSLISLVLHSDFVVKCVMLSLLFASIFSWWMIFKKVFLLRSCMRSVGMFQKILCTSNGLSKLRSHLIVDQTLVGSSLMLFISRVESLMGRNSVHGLEQKLRTIVDLEIGKISSRFDRGSDLLATTAGVAPFVGLFGTVWGIMLSFQAIGALKSVTLTVVAPSIGEALLATAVGLFVAIPALIFYNYISARTEQITQDLENLMWEIITTLDTGNEN